MLIYWRREERGERREERGERRAESGERREERGEEASGERATNTHPHCVLASVNKSNGRGAVVKIDDICQSVTNRAYLSTTQLHHISVASRRSFPLSLSLLSRHSVNDMCHQPTTQTESARYTYVCTDTQRGGGSGHAGEKTHCCPSAERDT